MNHCYSPIYNVVFSITSHSEKLYKVVQRLKNEAENQSNSKEAIKNPQISSIENAESLCWCS